MATLFANGRIYLGRRARFAEALVTENGRVVWTGELLEARRVYAAARVIDLRGGLMLPGFCDAHVHFLWWAIESRRLDLSRETRLDGALARIAEHARGLPAGAWLLGGRFDQNIWGRWPTAAELDAVAAGHPAVLRSRDGHSRWLNTPALERAGIAADTPTPAGGEIDRDSSGAPTGILRENAIRLIDAVIPQPSAAECAAALRWGQRRALAAGITAIHDLDNPQPPAQRGFDEMRRSGDLSLRVHMGIPHRSLDAALGLGIRTGLGDEWLRFSNVKIFSDGALGSQTAALEEPYEGRDYRGVLTIEPEQLREDVRRAAEGGIGVAVHAIGDRAVRVSLDAIEAARGSRDGVRHRLEHVQLVREQDVERFARLGVIASMQPIHATSDRDIADRHWGKRCRLAYPIRTLADAGVTLAFGSDAPVEPIEPLRGIHAAVARLRPTDSEPWYPEQRIEVEDAVAGYTAGPAFALCRERDLGTLDAGKWCDAVVVDRDIFRVPPRELLETTVIATVTDGEVRYDAGLD